MGAGCLTKGLRGCIRRGPSSTCHLQPPAQSHPPNPAGCQPMPPSSRPQAPTWPLSGWLSASGWRQESHSHPRWSPGASPWRPPPPPATHALLQDGQGSRDGHSGLEGRGGGRWHHVRAGSLRFLRTQVLDPKGSRPAGKQDPPALLGGHTRGDSSALPAPSCGGRVLAHVPPDRSLPEPKLSTTPPPFSCSPRERDRRHSPPC